MRHDRRKSFRVEWTSPASIDLGDGSPRLPCVVKNLSNGGARIASAKVLPDDFILRLTPGRCRPRSCHVVWRRDDEVGVQFTDAPALDETLVKNPAAEPVA
jgi:hypothetical protein